MVGTNVFFPRVLRTTFFVALALSLLLAITQLLQADIVTNPVSAFSITVDGHFTGGLSSGSLVGEWSDITPLAFISPPVNGGTLLRTNLGNPNANSLLYGGLAPGTVTPTTEPELYLMYDYLPRTIPVFFPGEFVADVGFPIHINGNPNATFITVQVRGSTILVNTASGGGDSKVVLPPSTAVDFLIDINGDQQPDGFADAFGIEGAIGFGPSTLSSLNHLLIELEVPLLLPSGFLEPNSPGHNGVYSPAPAFWGGSAANDGVDPPMSAAIFTINPGGSTTINNNFVPLPEPATVVLAGMGLVGLACAALKKRRMK